jgi:hypothetical protein
MIGKVPISGPIIANVLASREFSIGQKVFGYNAALPLNQRKIALLLKSGNAK